MHASDPFSRPQYFNTRGAHSHPLTPTHTPHLLLGESTPLPVLLGESILINPHTPPVIVHPVSSKTRAQARRGLCLPPARLALHASKASKPGSFVLFWSDLFFSCLQPEGRRTKSRNEGGRLVPSEQRVSGLRCTCPTVPSDRPTSPTRRSLNTLRQSNESSLGKCLPSAY